MAWNFADGFDLYAAFADMANGYWDSQASTGSSFIPGRFSGSQAVQITNNAANAVKSSGVNDPVHHIAVSFEQVTLAIGGSTLGLSFQLFDGTTAQCSIVFRSDGAILLVSGAPNSGTTLATYTGAFTAISTWYGFEIEVSINNTTGSFAVRKNGNTVNDFSATSLNTRGGTANNYANKLQVGLSGSNVNAHVIDDLFWRSGAATGSWLGELRCATMMPVSDQSVAFSKSPTSLTALAGTATGGGALATGTIRAAAVVAPTSGTLTALTCNFSVAVTGHVKMALYDNTGAGSGPGVLLATSAELTNPAAGAIAFSVTAGPSVSRGATYWVALWSDASTTTVGSGVATCQLTLTYTTSFPNPYGGAASFPTVFIGSNGMTVAPLNAGLVNDPQEDGLTTYVYDSNPGDQDFYGLTPLVPTGASVIATTTRAYMQKSDAGTRTAAVKLKSGATTVAAPTLTLTTSGFQWDWRTDLVDPNTSAAWTATAVNGAQIGPTVIS